MFKHFNYVIKSHIFIGLFTKGVQEDIEKVNNNHEVSSKQQKSTFQINLDRILPWKALDVIQSQLHVASVKSENIKLHEVISSIEFLTKMIQSQTLPTTIYRNCGNAVVQLIMLLGMFQLNFNKF